VVNSAMVQQACIDFWMKAGCIKAFCEVAQQVTQARTGGGLGKVKVGQIVQGLMCAPVGQ